MQIDEDERERRRKAVAAEIGCQALEGVRHSAEQMVGLQRYVNGEVSLDELRAELIERLKLEDVGIADEDEMSRA
ncbi:antitoxin VbhA family protein [Pseudomonas tussilaginis]|uniref:antitoxin VbhA family protein n=1 Tax=Pseudomonas sp. 5 TaxID=1619949 RepID=UPI0005EB8080|nr:antitoxin VbhA family protein [Pseudomonas sp. 5]KJK07865.1 hypothetical protein UB47_10620 [Pseudomonas sp. 5]